jgi:predicted amidohydrolase
MTSSSSSSSSSFRVASAQWPIERHASLADWRAKLERWMAEAAAGGAQLAVMPEYAPMELTSVLPEQDQGDLERQLHALQQLLPDYLELCRAAAVANGLYLVAGSFPEAAPTRFVNRLRLWSPRGEGVAIEKLHMTRFEREKWNVVAGTTQRVVETSLGVLGVAICYDSEFPLTVRRLVTAGAQVILVPSCTDTPAGYHRVRVACAARALENQCFVVQSPTVGIAPWSLAADENFGAAAVFAPPDRGFPDDGILAIGPRDVPHWLLCDLDLTSLDRVRIEGQVLGHRDFPDQDTPAPLEHLRL